MCMGHSPLVSTPNFNSSTWLTLSIKQNYRFLQNIISSRDYDVTKGALSTKASTYVELIASRFLKNEVAQEFIHSYLYLHLGSVTSVNLFFSFILSHLRFYPPPLLSSTILESWIPFHLSLCISPASQSLCPSIHDYGLKLCGNFAFPLNYH